MPAFWSKTLFEATILTVKIHAQTGDLVAKELGKISLVAAYLVENIAPALESFTS